MEETLGKAETGDQRMINSFDSKGQHIVSESRTVRIIRNQTDSLYEDHEKRQNQSIIIIGWEVAITSKK